MTKRSGETMSLEFLLQYRVFSSIIRTLFSEGQYLSPINILKSIWIYYFLISDEKSYSSSHRISQELASQYWRFWGNLDERPESARYHQRDFSIAILPPVWHVDKPFGIPTYKSMCQHLLNHVVRLKDFSVPSQEKSSLRCDIHSRFQSGERHGTPTRQYCSRLS